MKSILHPVAGAVAGLVLGLFMTLALAQAQEHEEHAALALPLRLAFMSGHVEAGLALYRAGHPEMAARHLLHPVSETHASEREGLDALGFDGDLFMRVSQALEDGVPAAQVEPQLHAAENNLAEVTDRAGGNPAEIIRFLMDTVLEEYAVGVQNGRVTDPGEYQDAYGFTRTALRWTDRVEGVDQAALMGSLQNLISLWAGPPVPLDRPASVDLIESRVRAVLAQLR